MRVLLSCLQSSERHPISAYQFWEPYFKRGIEEAGWEWAEVPDVDWAAPLVHSEEDVDALTEWRERSWERVLEFVQREQLVRPIDMFLGYLYPRHVEPQAIAQLKSRGIACVNFFCDNVREFRQVPNAYRAFDLHWVPEFGALSMYRDAGLSYVHAAMPVWVPPERRRADHEEVYGPTFIGGRDAQRESLFAEAIRLGADIRLRGPGWAQSVEPASDARPTRRGGISQFLANQIADFERFGLKGLFWKAEYRARKRIDASAFDGHVDEPAFGGAYADVTQQALVMVGVNRYHSYYHSFRRPGTYSRLRDIEAPMLGACYLTEWAEGLDEMYEIGSEIEVFRTARDLVEKIRHLSASPRLRASMRRQAQARALTDHSVPRSLNRIAAALGVPA